MYDTIVVGTDGSDTGTAAVRKAAGLAARLGARVVVVTAHEPGAPLPRRYRAHSDAAEGAASVDPVDAVLSEAEGICRREGATDVSTRRVVADPAVAIVDVASESDDSVIVVGNVGVRGGMRFLLGSIPNRVIQRAPCDVIVARTKETTHDHHRHEEGAQR